MRANAFGLAAGFGRLRGAPGGPACRCGLAFETGDLAAPIPTAFPDAIRHKRTRQTRTDSLTKIEPVSVAAANFRRETVSQRFRRAGVLDEGRRNAELSPRSNLVGRNLCSTGETSQCAAMYASRRMFDSVSSSSSRYLTTSPMLTMPPSFPLSMTVKCLKR